MENISKIGKISIIVPIFNSEKYIERCVSSILSQSYKNFELLLVDDGSTDGSGAICDNFSEIDNRVQVYHNPNKGVSESRNFGLEIATGKWCCFIDSDDWVEPTYLNNFIWQGSLSPQLIIQSFIIHDYIYKKDHIVHLPDKVFYSPDETVRFLEESRNVHNGLIWHRLFSKEIIDEYKIRFPKNVSFAEDGLFFLNYVKHVNTTVSTSLIGYHYIKRPGSLTSKGKKLPVQTYSFLFSNYIDTLFSFPLTGMEYSNHIDFSKKFACRLMSFWFVRNAYLCPQYKEEYIKALLTIEESYNFFSAKSLPLSQKMQVRFLKVKNVFVRDIMLKISLFISKIESKISRIRN